MYALLLAAALVAFEEPKPTPEGSGKPAMNVSLDGNWTVLCVEKNGKPVAEMKDKTVTVKGDVVTCDTDKSMPPMRLAFGPNATIRVTEANADGKFENVNTTDREPADSTKPSASKGTKSGVYVLTKDFLAICIHEDSANTGIRQVGGTEPATAPPAERPAGSTDRTDATAGKPNSKTYCTMILKRTDSK